VIECGHVSFKTDINVFIIYEETGIHTMPRTVKAIPWCHVQILYIFNNNIVALNVIFSCREYKNKYKRKWIYTFSLPHVFMAYWLIN
jgi:hypothetical protein